MSRRDHHRRKADVTIEFDHDHASPRVARLAIRPLISDPDDPIAKAVEAVTSELVSNVVEHTIDGGTVRAWDPKPDKPFHLEVADHDPARPVSPADPTDAGGRGLRIVSALSDDWGVENGDDGKTVGRFQPAVMTCEVNVMHYRTEALRRVGQMGETQLEAPKSR